MKGTYWLLVVLCLGAAGFWQLSCSLNPQGEDPSLGELAASDNTGVSLGDDDAPPRAVEPAQPMDAGADAAADAGAPDAAFAPFDAAAIDAGSATAD